MRYLLANGGISPQNKPEGWLLKMGRPLWRLLPQPFRYQFWVWWSNVLPYQKIVYRGKVLQWGRDRTNVYRAVFPAAPVGKTILDVGCHTGFYCFMAASEGAKYCQGIDHSVSRVEKGMALIAKEGITNIGLTSVDVFDFRLARPFDIVLCLNLLHHMQTLERALALIDKVYQWSKERVVFIVLLPRDPAAAHEHIIENGTRYVHLSARYFREKYFADRIEEISLDPGHYGANRSIVVLNKLCCGSP